MTATRRSLADLEAERDFLLASIDDLDAEHRAGDLADDDHRRLRDEYTVRAAEVIRSIDDRRSGSHRPPGGEAAAPTARRRLPWIVGMVVVAVAAGWLLAQAVGERGVAGQITGDIDASPRERFFECQQLDQRGDIPDANECYADLLVDDPQNVEALAYRGWLLVRTAGSAQQLGADAEAAEVLASARVLLDEAVRIDPGYPDARAFRVIVWNAEGDVERACAEYDELVALDPPPFMLGLIDQMAPLDC